MIFPLLLGVVLVVYPLGAVAQTSLVQATGCSFKGRDCKTSPTGEGNLIVIGWQVSKQSVEPAPINSVTDNAGNLFRNTSAGRRVKLPDGSVVDIWYATNSLPGANSLVITSNSGFATGEAMVWEFSSIQATLSPDQFKAADWVRLIASDHSKAKSQSGMPARKAVSVSSKTSTRAIDAANACDINRDGNVDVLDGQSAVNIACRGGICNGGLPTQVINASLGGPCTHSVLLTWKANTAAKVAGYNIYRGDAPRGPYKKVNLVLVLGVNYTDATVEAGRTYYYVATTVDNSRIESSYSNEASVVVPAQ